MNMIDRLRLPAGKLDVVLDTDAYNEIDDQYAISYLLYSRERICLKAIYAAPFYDKDRSFHNFKSASAAEGMERSYQEIQKLLTLAGRADMSDRVFRGADRFLPAGDTPVDSPAAEDLIRRAMNYSPETPLYVASIAAPTNVASALLMAPEIAERIVVVWLGGNILSWPGCREFNMSQDLYASRVLFGDQVALVQVPCMGMASSFTVTPLELTHFLKGKSPLCDYLVDLTLDAHEADEESMCWSRPIWDVTACAWLMGPKYALDRFTPKPYPGFDGMYAFNPCRPLMRYVYHINRDALMDDLMKKLSAGG